MARFPDHPDRRPAVVTGASSGIGAATARALAAQGFPVALGARRAERCEQLATEIRAQGGEAFAHQLDVGDPASVAAFHKAVGEALGPVEVVVSNAGGMRPGRIWEIGTDAFEHELNTNVLGAHRLLTTFGAEMVRRGRGDIVMISSDVVPTPRPHLGAYVAAKAALEGMTRVLQMELEGTGVRATILRPGPTRTDIANEWDEQPMVEAVVAQQKWGLLRHHHTVRPEQIALVVAQVVSLPRGAHVPVVDVAPEAPVEVP
jgi:NAD(P)-dependent dehydrogenase (short-subunit alcohol dehydrogenase family)